MKRTINVAFLSIACIVSSARAGESTGKLSALKQSLSSINLTQMISRARTSAQAGLTSAQASVSSCTSSVTSFVLEKPFLTAGIVAGSVAAVCGIIKARSCCARSTTTK